MAEADGKLLQEQDDASKSVASPEEIEGGKLDFTSSADNSTQPSREGTPPPLPPRRVPGQVAHSPAPSLRLRRSPTRPGTSSGVRPPLQAKATTALSLADIHVQSHGSDEIRTPTSRHISFAGMRIGRSRSASDADDTYSVQSYAPTLEVGGEGESMLGDVLQDSMTPGLKPMSPAQKALEEEESLFPLDARFDDAFDQEFDELDDITSDGLNEAQVIQQWKSKLKHYLILSNAGKPIWSRHGNDTLITSYIGIIQTLISFYQDAASNLKAFTAGGVRFVVISRGPLNLVAISKLGESDAQLRAQLEALYMQILSTLTLPVMERMFRARASTDLRRPLQGTESLLSALADGFTRGSPSTLLGALECLRLRKSHRTAINNTFLKTRTPALLYGLLVASGRLVSVIRPRKHSLHPGDLHLIFNMLFEAGGVKAGGGENWIPLCLPGFNNTGYLYMYVSFLDLENPLEEVKERPKSADGKQEEEVAILLISAEKEGFYEMRAMRDELVKQLYQNNSLKVVREAVRRGRLSCTDIAPGTVLRHFLYKSRGNVQFIMPSYDPYFPTLLTRRKLLTLYTHLQASLHAHPVRPKIHHETASTHTCIAWSTPVFELYAVAPASATKSALAMAANKVVQFVRREDERVFIIGGAVF
ncbi:uncharacterized protein PV09_05944 [Verruconis gallopava]|uniref:Vacuolar fusion protein MON1 n=1 Tax=Verruconis gallopava TaxID=253628 RepID=A0A0D2AUR1_9PEZI|nr:uncharacterized protein PV09_05944 [Verruconis gallopava]KIW02894.1 hypothetical protein PV09_05944 [Verruconis gallopava]